MKKYVLLLLLFSFICQFSFCQADMPKKFQLMPWPKSIEEHNSRLTITNNISISVTNKDKGRVYNAATKFLRRLSGRTGIFIDQGFPVKSDTATIQISFDRVSSLNIEEKESYTLDIRNSKVLINASTDVGALRALETLLQLTNHDNEGFYFPGVSIKDEPRFVWRGLMIDVSRHFQPVDVIKRNLDAMAAVKMNVFHWHLTDDQGFRIPSRVYPKIQELSTDGLFYTHSQIKDIVSYASDLGIRVIPEIDIPGHASALLAAYPELGSKDDYNYSVERNSGVFDPTLDPTKDITYEFLENLFTEITPLFPDEYFHIGGDENEGKHWDENEGIQKFKKDYNLESNHDLQTYFNVKIEKILNKLGKKLMGWDEIMTPNMPTTAVIHSWRGEHEGLKESTLIEAAKQGYQSVLSAGYYIDRMLSVEHHYMVDPIGDKKLTFEERERVLGGEATMWSELVTPLTIDSRIWPRTAAIAERFWSQKEVNDVDDMLYRLNEVSFRLEELGITHIKNRDVILRSMTNNQDISSLIALTKICEPLKIYSRNQGGTEYKTYSPFTLFADACVVDAGDAMGFKKAAAQFTENSDSRNTSLVLQYLQKWSENHKYFLKIVNNPNVKPLTKLSENLSEISTLLSTSLTEKSVNENTLAIVRNNIKVLSQSFVDVEVVIVSSLMKLSSYCETHYLSN